MSIDPVGQSIYPAILPNPATVPEENGDTQESAVIAAPDAIPDEPVGAAEEQNDEAKAKGVLRLLQAGHFQGVADVRLRINFHNEIVAMESEQYAQTAQQGMSDLQSAIGDQMTTLLDNPDLDETTATGIGDALETFNATLTQPTADTSTLTDQIRADFDNLVSSLKTVLGIQAQDDTENSEEITPADAIVEDAPQMAAQVANETPADTPEAASAVDYQAFVDALISTFETKMQEFESSLTDIKVLPDLSAPHGNGKAYDKFVAMYNDMQMPPATPTAEPTIDTNA